MTHSHPSRLSPYEYLETEPIEADPEARNDLLALRGRLHDVHLRRLVLGVVLCVLSPIPLFAAILVFGESEFAHVCSVCLLLALVALGVFLLVSTAMITESFHMLLEEDDYTRAKKAMRKRHAPLYAAYWLFSTAVYLAVSFVTGRWDRSWIVWPVAGVLFPFFALLLSALHKSDDLPPNRP